MSINVHLIKNILITESNQHVTVNMHLTTHEYGISVCPILSLLVQCAP